MLSASFTCSISANLSISLPHALSFPWASFSILSLSSVPSPVFIWKSIFEMVILFLLISFSLSYDKLVSTFFCIKAILNFKVLIPKEWGWLFKNTYFYSWCNKTSLVWHQVSMRRLEESYLNYRKLLSPAKGFF